ncbi:biotinidase [Myripristis murdjan]|uniref:Biotinidase n=1 Tax=Myripristis murdjan TaxID=586833 RepID=A0A667Y4E0_9TELE|nr:biotinidase [Myripristis murdjan]XP_029919301.1 biotinidase [Myripristis murdjan]
MDLTAVAAFIFAFMFPSCHTSDPGPTETTLGRSFIAAVYEHRVILNPEPHVALARPAALQHLHANLDEYERQAARAARQGVQILVFPEDGLQGFNFSRSSIAGYLETIPDPQQESWNPCTEPGRHNNTEVLQRLSCMARRHGLYLVANMADLQPCPLTSDPSSSCPSDGHWQFNTNVVFSSDGLLVARYHKHNLYFEKAFDKPPHPEIITFDTPFAGRFGVLTCFDLLFHEPTVTLVKRGVRQLVYPTGWMNQLPLMAAVQFQRAFSLGANVSILAANIRSDPLGMTGSGIFSPMSGLHHHARQGDAEEGRLLVATVPVLDPLWTGEEVEKQAAPQSGERNRETMEEVRGESCSSRPVDSGFCLKEERYVDSPPPGASAPSPPPSPATFTSSMMYDPFTFALLHGTEGELSVCDGPLCCHLQYRQSLQSSSTELYALGAFAGTHTVNGRYALQVCALVRCAGSEASSCGQEVEEAETKMDFLLEGTFGTPYVYPSVLASGLVLEQPERLERTADGGMALRHSNMSAGLVTACLYGRMYHLDLD